MNLIEEINESSCLLSQFTRPDQGRLGARNNILVGPYIIINPEITLTAFRPEDKALLAQYLNDPVIYQNTSNIPKNYSEQDAEEWLLKVAKRREELGIETSWVIRHQQYGLMGSIGRVAQTGVAGHSDEIGYWLGTPFRGKGIMSAVVVVFSNWLFETPPLIRLEARAFPHNPASIRVLEKAGFEKEGYARKKFIKDGEYLDSVLMARVKNI